MNDVTTTLVRLSVPRRLKDEMIIKEGAAFRVPNSNDGHKLLFWWKTASIADRDDVMRRAFNKGSTLVQAWNEKLAEAK